MNLRKVILFAGTTEGRQIGEALVEHGNVEIHVATEYGKNLLPESKENYQVFEGRLDKNAMMEIMKSEKDSQNSTNPIVVDATHPYAVEVTKNIKAAAKETGSQYYRVLRGEDEEIDWKRTFKDQIIYAESLAEAAKILGELGERALITTGSKELFPFTQVEGYKELFTVRILPLEGAFKAAIDAGFEGRNLIAMQGPFSVKMNRALIDQSEAKVLVTKESGKQGGFVEKLMAARDENIKVIVIKRPNQEQGYGVSEILHLLASEGIKIIENQNSLEDNQKIQQRWFPIFMDSSNKKAIIFGGGTIGERRAETLLKFQWQVKIIAKTVSDKIKKMAEENLLTVELKEVGYDQISNFGLEEFDMVIGATDNIQLNLEICQKGKELGKWANDAGCKENCNFYFPAVSMGGNVTVGINGQGKNHKMVRYIREKIDKLLDENNEDLGTENDEKENNRR